MGTRGIFGFRSGQRDFITYNHFDSYPSELGAKVVRFIRDDDLSTLPARVQALRLVPEDGMASAEDVDRLARFADPSVSTRDLAEWYVLLRGTQGNPAKVLEAGVMIDSHEFVKDSLFCEWGYIINLDENTLEVYRGFQDQPHDHGRYAHLSDGDWTPEFAGQSRYYPIALIGTLPLWVVKPMRKEHFIAAVDRMFANILTESA